MKKPKLSKLGNLKMKYPKILNHKCHLNTIFLLIIQEMIPEVSRRSRFIIRLKLEKRESLGKNPIEILTFIKI